MYLGPDDGVPDDGVPDDALCAITAGAEKILVDGGPELRKWTRGNEVLLYDLSSKTSSHRCSMDLSTITRGKALLRFIGNEGSVILN